MRYELYDYYNAPCGRSATAEELEALRAELLAAPDTDEMPAMAEAGAPGAPCNFDLGGGRLVPIINVQHALAWRARHEADLVAKG